MNIKTESTVTYNESERRRMYSLQQDDLTDEIKNSKLNQFKN